MTLLEPAVALTDLVLAVENTAFALLLARHGHSRAVRHWWQWFFTALAVAATLGFVSHGLIADKTSTSQQVVWTLLLLVIGLIALPAAALGAQLLRPRNGRFVIHLAVVLYALYALIVLAGFRRYAIAIAVYLPAALLLLAGFMVRAWRTPAPHWRAGLLGLALTFAAALLQQWRVGLDPVHFNHNALYHLLQALALWLLYRAARGQLQERPP